MDSEGFERRWAALSEEVLSGMADWRAQHPRATLSESEAAVDVRLARMRARMLAHVALQSQAAAWSGRAEGEVAHCPEYGGVLQPQGHRTRRLKTHGGQQLTLRRAYGLCQTCQQGLFPPG